LGRVSVVRATETADIDTLEGYLEAAVTYFIKSSKEQDFGPARFCLPFYRTYMAIIFLEATQEEIERYLAEAKGAVGGSESKDELLNAVENLARALQESQRLKNRPIQEIASELSAYRWYCDKAAEYMITAEDKAPVAVKLLKKCNPIIGDRIQATIAEIQGKAKQICQITHGSGTEFEAPGTEIDRAAKALSIEDIHRTQRCVTRITSQLKEFCRLLPECKRELICGVIEEIELATEFPDKLDKIELGITYVSSAVETVVQLEEIRHEIHKVAGQILKRLNQNQMHTVQTVLNALEKKEYHDRQFQELADKLDAVVSELKRKHIEDPAMKNDVDEAYSYLKDPEMNINDRIMVTIPLIPIFLTYQGVIELQSGRNLLGAWNKLKSSLRLDNKIR
jgi:hypothetical protein